MNDTISRRQIRLFLIAAAFALGCMTVDCWRGPRSAAPPVAKTAESQPERDRVRILEKRDADGSTTTISEPADRCLFECASCDALERDGKD